MEPYYITEVEKTPHSETCTCWECLEKIEVTGKCAYCSNPIVNGEGTQNVHWVCWEPYREYLQGDSNWMNGI